MKIFGNKKQHQLAKKVVENYLLGEHALDLAESDGYRIAVMLLKRNEEGTYDAIKR